MEIIQVLIIVVVIIVALVKQLSKPSQEAEQRQSQRNVPKYDDEYDYEEIDAEYQSEGKAPFLSYDYEQPASPKNKNQKTSRKGIEAPPPVQEEPESESEFAIHSDEEARRAIVWSEILNRKY